MLATTHLAISPHLVGEPLDLGPGRASAALTLLPEMAADALGLVHGGFVFGLFGKQPHLGEAVEYDGAELTIEKTDGRRIHKVKIVKIDHPESEGVEAESRD